MKDVVYILVLINLLIFQFLISSITFSDDEYFSGNASIVLNIVSNFSISMLFSSVYLVDGINWTVNTALEFVIVFEMMLSILVVIESIEAVVIGI